MLEYLLDISRSFAVDYRRPLTKVRLMQETRYARLRGCILTRELVNL